MHRRALKYLPRVAVLLLVAALINVLMAWACAIWSDRTVAIENGIMFRFGPMGGWSVDVFTATDREFLTTSPASPVINACMYRSTFGLDRRIFVPDSPTPFGRALPPAPAGFNMNRFAQVPEAAETRSGWPFQSMRARQWLNPNNPPGQTYSYDTPLVVVTGTTSTGAQPVRRALPIDVIWSGFVRNMLLYALAILILVGGVRFIRRALRAKRKCCCECGYPIGVSPVCTECGAAVTQTQMNRAITRQRLGSLLWCVIACGAASVALAWLCALHAPTLYSSVQPRRIQSPPWWTDVDKGVHPTRRNIGLGFVVDEFRHQSWGCNLIRGGWPMIALEHAVEFWDNNRNRAERVHHGLAIPAWLQGRTWDRKYLPMRPNWAGIVVNALVWGGIAWGVMHAGSKWWKQQMH